MRRPTPRGVPGAASLFQRACAWRPPRRQLASVVRLCLWLAPRAQLWLGRSRRRTQQFTLRYEWRALDYELHNVKPGQTGSDADANGWQHILGATLAAIIVF